MKRDSLPVNTSRLFMFYQTTPTVFYVLDALITIMPYYEYNAANKIENNLLLVVIINSKLIYLPRKIFEK